MELAPFRIPKVECWFPGDLPLSAIEETLIVEIVRGPRSPLVALLKEVVLLEKLEKHRPDPT